MGTLYILCDDIDVSKLVELNKDTVNFINISDYEHTENWPIPMLETIKASMAQYEITFINRNNNKDLEMCLDALSIVYKRIGINNGFNLERFDLNIDNKTTIENLLKNQYEWLKIESEVQNSLVETENTEITTKDNRLSFDKILNDDVQLTEADIREFKQIQNKLKVGLILQAKSSLSRILKMTSIMDKVYDELFERIDTSVGTADTASLMYTADYLAKALNETNQFITSLVNNDKIQNFFIIDNSNVVNIGDDVIDADKRERIRKATEIVMNNLDYFEEGEYNKMKDPNVIEVQGDDTNGNT